MSAPEILRCFSTDGHDDLPATVERLPTVGEVRQAVAELIAVNDETDTLRVEVERLRTELRARNTRLVILADALLDIKNNCVPDTFAYRRAADALKGGENG